VEWTRTPASSGCSSTVVEGRRHADQPDAGRRADPRRRGAGNRRALYENASTGPDGQLLNGNLADYSCDERRDVATSSARTSRRRPSQLAVRREGRGGGRHGRRAWAIMNAINDALARRSGPRERMPFTPERVLTGSLKV